MKNSVITFLCLCFTVLETGCVSLFPEGGTSPKRLYLEPQVTQTGVKRQGREVIAVVKPTATTALSGYRLQVRYIDQEIPLVDQVAGVEWQDELPSMVQRHLVKALAASGFFKAAGFEADSFKRDVILETDIQSFDVVVLKDRFEAEVTLSCKLLSSKGRAVLWQKDFSARAPIDTHSLLGFSQGLKVAYEQVLTQVISAF